MGSFMHPLRHPSSAFVSFLTVHTPPVIQLPLQETLKRCSYKTPRPQGGGAHSRIMCNCAAGASLRVPQNRSRAGSPRRSAGGARLVDFLREFGEHLWVSFWELLAVTGSLLGFLGVVPGASRSGQILSVRRRVHPTFASFFFWSRFWIKKMEF